MANKYQRQSPRPEQALAREILRTLETAKPADADATAYILGANHPSKLPPLEGLTIADLHRELKSREVAKINEALEILKESKFVTETYGRYALTDAGKVEHRTLSQQ
jgi:hypothetical protein